MNDRNIIVLGALNMLVAVGAGAFGAHGLRRLVTPDMLAVWQTGVTYHLIHALGLLAIALMMPRLGGSALSWAATLMFIGIVLFSGSLYALTLTGTKVLGAVTPLGGVAFLVSWALVAWSAWSAGR